MNSQNTNAIGGSNCKLRGTSRFHANHRTVQVRTIRKNPMMPTRSVIQQASLSRVLRLLDASRFTFRSLLRCSLKEVNETGRPGASAGALFMVEPQKRSLVRGLAARYFVIQRLCQ